MMRTVGTISLIFFSVFVLYKITGAELSELPQNKPRCGFLRYICDSSSYCCRNTLEPTQSISPCRFQWVLRSISVALASRCFFPSFLQISIFFLWCEIYPFIYILMSPHSVREISHPINYIAVSMIYMLNHKSSVYSIHNSWIAYILLREGVFCWPWLWWGRYACHNLSENHVGYTVKSVYSGLLSHLLLHHKLPTLPGRTQWVRMLSSFFSHAFTHYLFVRRCTWINCLMGLLCRYAPFTSNHPTIKPKVDFRLHIICIVSSCADSGSFLTSSFIWSWFSCGKSRASTCIAPPLSPWFWEQSA